MEQADLNIVLINLLCCSANKADLLSTALQKGYCDTTDELVILNGLLEIISYYSLTNPDLNCVTEEQFLDAIDKATNICEYCKCLNN
jgi:hypothetical protein